VAVSKSPLVPLQKALVALLGGDSTLTTLLTSAGRVLDQVTEQTPKPYVRVGEHLSIPDNDHSGFGREVTETIHVWTKARSNGPGQLVADRINELLDHQTAALKAYLVPLGHRAVSVRSEFDQALTDPDPEIRHHVLRFRVITDQLT
jgi:hypothetical protein